MKKRSGLFLYGSLALGMAAGAWAEPTPVPPGLSRLKPLHPANERLERRDPNASRLKPLRSDDRLKPRHSDDKLKPRHSDDKLKPKHPDDRLKPRRTPELSEGEAREESGHLKNEKDSEGEVGQSQGQQLQQAMDQDSKMDQTLSNAEKKESDSDHSVTKNLK